MATVVVDSFTDAAISALTSWAISTLLGGSGDGTTVDEVYQETIVTNRDLDGYRASLISYISDELDGVNNSLTDLRYGNTLTLKSITDILGQAVSPYDETMNYRFDRWEGYWIAQSDNFDWLTNDATQNIQTVLDAVTDAQDNIYTAIDNAVTAINDETDNVVGGVTSQINDITDYGAYSFGDVLDEMMSTARDHNLHDIYGHIDDLYDDISAVKDDVDLIINTTIPDAITTLQGSINYSLTDVYNEVDTQADNLAGDVSNLSSHVDDLIGTPAVDVASDIAGVLSAVDGLAFATPGDVTSAIEALEAWTSQGLMTDPLVADAASGAYFQAYDDDNWFKYPDVFDFYTVDDITGPDYRSNTDVYNRIATAETNIEGAVNYHTDTALATLIMTLPTFYPGSDNVTWGNSIPFTESTVIEHAMDGCVITIVTPAKGYKQWSANGFLRYAYIGEFGFLCDEGAAEEFQYLQWQQHLATPKHMRRAAGIVLNCVPGTTGAVTPYLIGSSA